MTITNTLAQGDLLPILQAVLTQGANEATVDLTGCTVTLRMVNAVTKVVAINGASCVIASAKGGQVTYTWQPADTATAGTYLLQFLVIAPGGASYHFPNGGGTPLTITPTV